MMVMDRVVVPPALVALQVNVTPAVSVVTEELSHPVEVYWLSLSTTLHVAVTLEVYQPFCPRVPLMVGVTTGAVVSEGFGTVTLTVKLPVWKVPDWFWLFFFPPVAVAVRLAVCPSVAVDFT